MRQGRIDFANDYPTFARTMLIVGQKLMILRQITLKRVRNLPVFMKIMQILQIFWVKHTNSLIFQHPIVGSLKLNSLPVRW